MDKRVSKSLRSTLHLRARISHSVCAKGWMVNAGKDERLAGKGTRMLTLAVKG